jgi:hypothetical protein
MAVSLGYRSFGLQLSLASLAVQLQLNREASKRSRERKRAKGATGPANYAKMA